MKGFKQCVALFLLIALVLQFPAAVFADIVSAPNVTVLGNDFIKVTVNNDTGRFGIRTVEGQPIRKKDQNVNMIFAGDNPETSFTTFRIDGTDYIFGNPYKFAPSLFSEISRPVIVDNKNGTKQIETVWKIKGVEIKQILMLYADVSDKKNAGNVNIRYEVNNRSGAEVQVGTRLLLDTMVGGNDGPAFQIGNISRNPLQVERKLVHDPDSSIPEGERLYHKLPAYWVMKDKLDPSNPLATNVLAYGFNNFSEGGINIVDEMIVGHWNSMANTKWEYNVNPNLDFTTDTNDYGSADSAVAFYWNPDRVTSGNVKTFETVYGLGEIVAPDRVFSIRNIDPVHQMGTLEDGSAYENEGIFDITAEIENIASYNMLHSRIVAALELESGLSFVKLDERGKIVRDSNGKAVTEAGRSKALTLYKTATPEEAAQGITPKYKPGETVAVSFKVKAQGKSWPATKQYLLTASSPETEQKLETIKDEDVKAAYQSSKADFILLPPIGDAKQTLVYALSPEEAFSTDVKYVTVNMSNIEAYSAGDANAPANFDLFFREVASGKRYKVPVNSSVILQPTNSGEIGDMRITYRTGDLVDDSGQVVEDENGKPMKDLGPELPLGEYNVEVDYKGDAGGDSEVAALLDVKTRQTFAVTENEEARVRKANILTVVKRVVTLENESGAPLDAEAIEAIEAAFPGYKATNLARDIGNFKAVKSALEIASSAVEPGYDMDSAMSLEEVPAYQLMPFESEDELEAYKEENEEDEILVEITGMISQIGSGEEAKYVVDTTTEPAIINKAVAYKGKDMVFVNGEINIFGGRVDFSGVPFLDSLIVKGDGTLSVASSGFVFHKGEWTLDFFNGFDKSLRGPEDEEGEEEEEENEPNGEEDDSLNGSLNWAVGGLGDRLNPMRQLMLEDVYFNRHSLFAAPSFSIEGFGLKFNDFILREGGISFGGALSLKILESEIKNVVFNDKGFVGIDAGLKFELEQDVGLIGAGDAGEQEKSGVSGEINIVHYVQDVEGIDNTYGLKFDADLKGVTTIGVEIEFKQVDDGRILPNVIGFSADLPEPGVLITAGTYLTSVRGAIRELADTIAGGTSDVPLTIEAGADISFGVQPATFYGKIDLILKRSGFKLTGKLDYAPDANSEKLEMLKEASVGAQWMTPWFVFAKAEVDVLGWDVIIGKASIFIGQNLEKNRIDFEGFVGAKVQVPGSVPVVGGLALGGISLGVNNDKMWGGLTILFISLGITYYFDGDIEIGTSGEGLPEGYIYLKVDDPETGPKLVVIGEGIETLATSWESEENEQQEVVYRNVADGVEMIDTGTMNLGIGGIEASNGGKKHVIPMAQPTGDALVEVQYSGETEPNLELKDSRGNVYKLEFDQTKPTANAFVQRVSDKGVAANKVYIAIPKNVIEANRGNWTLVSNQAVKTKLLNIPQLAKLDEIKLERNAADANQFTASWKVPNAKPGDKINLYLTKDAVTNATTMVDGAEVINPGDVGLLIAKDIDVANNGSTVAGTTTGNVQIDVTNVSLLGDTEDIRGLLAQGEYYLRAELKSATNFQTKTATDKFEIIDPLAPAEVTDVQITPAGNGFFELSFKPAVKKPGQTSFEHSYAIEALQQSGDQLVPYPNFGSLLFTETELASHWNATDGKYEHIRLGGWTAMSNSNEVNPSSLTGKASKTPDKHTGLEVGQHYVVGVSSAVKPSKAVDKNENLHYSNSTYSVNTLLPVPSKPKLTLASAAPSKVTVSDNGAYFNLITNSTKQIIGVTASQSNVTVEALYDEKSIGSVDLSGSNSGKLELSNFKTDGTYAVELKARNKLTGDFSITMLYLTVDTMAPVLYIDEPITGGRTENGKVVVKGTTTKGATLTVNGSPITVADDGKFDDSVPITFSDPKMKLEFVTIDDAGNRNEAAVEVLNDAVTPPVALILNTVAPIQPNQSKKIEVKLRVPNGKDKGKQLYKEIAVPADELDKLTFESYAGEAAIVAADGTVTGLQDGAIVVRALYQASEDAQLEAMAVVKVDSGLESIEAHASSVTGNAKVTKVTVQSAGDLKGHELVYRVYPNRGSVVVPNKQDNLGSWSVLPANGEIGTVTGNWIIVAKRNSTTKLVAAASQPIEAVLWTPAPGGGGGGGAPSGPAETTVNGHKLDSKEVNGTIVTEVPENVVKDGQPLVIITKGGTVERYEYNLSKGLWQRMASNGQPIGLELPFAELNFRAAETSKSSDAVKVTIARNDSATRDRLADIAKQLQASLLGAGQGATFVVQASEIYDKQSVFGKIAVPDGVKPEEITAVVLLDEQGKWTTIPWKLDSKGNIPYVSVRLTGNGSIAFLSNAKSFKDVGDQSWAKKIVSDAVGKLFMLGRSGNLFDPDKAITRAEYPTVLLRVLGLMNEQATASFADVAAKDWFSNSVAIAVKNGIVTGFKDGSYKPNEKLSRIEAMVMVGRSMKAIGLDAEITLSEADRILAGFKDGASIPDWAKVPVALCIQRGVISGQNGYISPDDALTRAQAAAIAVRLSELIPTK
ncbi:S-layer homology domain-containing protein [Cohnella herbarum]|uniref:S-layer homology domain-containing protein n=1 Tax=Cohnella herbarum TaxID=2728023 RepID=A0A7Z2VJX0_9BACL|nr:S-layer homology domain-containing protein [Cohnella herbarum]QJD84596.1 S-layer homology domain-containing protein [Cohnella herbarum]